ncbi:MAG: amidohydrolase family protein [Lentisphaeria bacterium]|nr:amidohydrolase family protein [Lentisphaeria bacterium]
MIQTRTGNIITHEEMFFGTIEWQDQKITKIEKNGPFREEADRILAGFIEVHHHGTGPYTVESAGDIRGMAEFAPQCGTTTLCPTQASATREFFVKILRETAAIAKAEPLGAKIAGTHMEGPFLDLKFKGGMIPEMLRLPTIEEVRDYLEAADGTLKIMTIAPELPGALKVIRFLKENGVTVSAGHTNCPPEFLGEAIDAGLSQMCHLFDAYDCPTSPEGVRLPALTDIALIRDEVMKEVIMDGLHVPPELITLTRRAAGAAHIIGITDAMQGAGMKYARFQNSGEWYTVREGELARREQDNAIVGSSLSMNRAFYNMTHRFGFTRMEATMCLSANPAKALHQEELTGRLTPGLLADIAILAPDDLTVKECIVNGRTAFAL